MIYAKNHLFHYQKAYLFFYLFVLLKNVMKLKKISMWQKNKIFNNQGPVVRSVVSLTSSLKVILLTVLADSIYNMLIFFAEKI